MDLLDAAVLHFEWICFRSVPAWGGMARSEGCFCADGWFFCLVLSLCCCWALREGGHCTEMAMVCLTDFEEYAKEHLSKATWDYYAAGADECCTRDDNLLAYKRYSPAKELHHILNMQDCFQQRCSCGHRWVSSSRGRPHKPKNNLNHNPQCIAAKKKIARRYFPLFIMVGEHIRQTLENKTEIIKRWQRIHFIQLM